MKPWCRAAVAVEKPAKVFLLAPSTCIQILLLIRRDSKDWQPNYLLIVLMQLTALDGQSEWRLTAIWSCDPCKQPACDQTWHSHWDPRVEKFGFQILTLLFERSKLPRNDEEMGNTWTLHAGIAASWDRPPAAPIKRAATSSPTACDKFGAIVCILRCTRSNIKVLSASSCTMICAAWVTLSSVSAANGCPSVVVAVTVTPMMTCCKHHTDLLVRPHNLLWVPWADGQDVQTCVRQNIWQHRSVPNMWQYGKQQRWGLKLNQQRKLHC